MKLFCPTLILAFSLALTSIYSSSISNIKGYSQFKNYFNFESFKRTGKFGSTHCCIDNFTQNGLARIHSEFKDQISEMGTWDEFEELLTIDVFEDLYDQIHYDSLLDCKYILRNLSFDELVHVAGITDGSLRLYKWMMENQYCAFRSSILPIVETIYGEHFKNIDDERNAIKVVLSKDFCNLQSIVSSHSHEEYLMVVSVCNSLNGVNPNFALFPDNFDDIKLIAPLFFHPVLFLKENKLQRLNLSQLFKKKPMGILAELQRVFIEGYTMKPYIGKTDEFLKLLKSIPGMDFNSSFFGKEELIESIHFFDIPIIRKFPKRIEEIKKFMSGHYFLPLPFLVQLFQESTELTRNNYSLKIAEKFFTIFNLIPGQKKIIEDIREFESLFDSQNRSVIIQRLVSSDFDKKRFDHYDLFAPFVAEFLFDIIGIDYSPFVKSADSYKSLINCIDLKEYILNVKSPLSPKALQTVKRLMGEDQAERLFLNAKSMVDSFLSFFTEPSRLNIPIKNSSFKHYMQSTEPLLLLISVSDESYAKIKEDLKEYFEYPNNFTWNETDFLNLLKIKYLKQYLNFDEYQDLETFKLKFQTSIATISDLNIENDCNSIPDCLYSLHDVNTRLPLFPPFPKTFDEISESLTLDYFIPLELILEHLIADLNDLESITEFFSFFSFSHHDGVFEDMLALYDDTH